MIHHKFIFIKYEYFPSFLFSSFLPILLFLLIRFRILSALFSLHVAVRYSLKKGSDRTYWSSFSLKISEVIGSPRLYVGFLLTYLT